MKLFVCIFALVALLAIFDQTKAKPSKTDDCLTACTDDYTPVCGEDGNGHRKTFPNVCGMGAENCHKKGAEVYKQVKQGEC